MLKVDTGSSGGGGGDDGSRTERRGGSESGGNGSEVGVFVQQDNLLHLASRSSELLQVVANELEPVQSRINDFSNYLHKFSSLLLQRTSSQTIAAECALVSMSFRFDSCLVVPPCH